MRRRVGDLERKADQIDEGLRYKWASMVQAWRTEFGYSLPVEEVFSLSREIHAGSPEAHAAYETIRVEMEAHVRARAEEWRDQTGEDVLAILDGA